MHIFENEITLGNRPILDEYMNSYEYKTSGLSFSSMYMWRNIKKSKKAGPKPCFLIERIVNKE